VSHAGDVQPAAGQLESTAEKPVMAVNLTQGAIMDKRFTSKELLFRVSFLSFDIVEGFINQLEEVLLLIIA